MGFKLFVRFTGLCAFVPNTSGKQMRVVLTDATKAATMGGMPMPIGFEPHLPVLVFDQGDLSHESGRTFMTFIQDNVSKGLCRLDGQDLTIDPSKPAALAISNGAVADCPLPATDLSTSWLANMKKILGGTGAIKDACLAPANVDPSVTARIALTDGSLRTRSFSAMENKQPIRWQFGAYTQVLAEVIELELDLPGDTVTFRATSFRDTANPPTPIPPLVLRPKPAGPQGPSSVIVRIENMPLPDIQGTRLVGPDFVVLNQKRARDEHFPLLFSLATNTPANGSGLVPLPVDVCKVHIPPVPSPTLGSPQCPGGAFNPHPGA